MTALVTILIPHFKTLELTKLCLRLIKKNTDLKKVQIIVIDNHSQDASLDYLRQLKWITLLERHAIHGETPVQSHARALDLGLAQVNTPYILSIHTDSLIKHPQWLDFLLTHIQQHQQIAGVGSWKLENKIWWRNYLKKIERYVQCQYYQIIKKENHALEGIGKNYYYLRSHCALYRTRLLRDHHLYFSDGDMVAGKSIHKRLVDEGFKMIFLPSDVLSRYIEHVNHATTVLNPHLSSREKSVTNGLRRIQKTLNRLGAADILADDKIDSLS